MWYPIKAGKMGNKPHKIGTARWLMRILRTFSKITKGEGRRGIRDEADNE